MRLIACSHPGVDQAELFFDVFCEEASSVFSHPIDKTWTAFCPLHDGFMDHVRKLAV